MIRTNLATRPFYNERAVHLAILLLALIVVLASIFNVARVVQLSRSDTRLGTQASRDEDSAAERRQGGTMTLLKRIVVEKRSLLVPLGVALLINVAVYALVVYPLETKAATASDRARAAAQSLRAAERELAAARALVSGKSHADQELSTFYDKVLPPDFAA